MSAAATVPPAVRTEYYAGADWLDEVRKEPVSEFGRRVADLVGWWQRGIYHLQNDVLRADWSGDRFITFTIYSNGLSTFDNSMLTRLVVGAHDRAIRVEISPAGPHRLRLMFHPREPELEELFHRRHPTIERAIEYERAT